MQGLITVHNAATNARVTAYLDVTDDSPLAEAFDVTAQAVAPDVQLNEVDVALNGRRVDPQATVGELGVHEGAWISLVPIGYEPIPTRPEPHRSPEAVQLRFISGVGAGTVFDVADGTVSISALLDPDESSMLTDFMLTVDLESQVTLFPHIQATQHKHKSKLGFRRKKLNRSSDIFIDGTEILEPTVIEFSQEIVLPDCIVTITNETPKSVPLDTVSEPGRWLFARPPKIRAVIEEKKYRLPGEPAKPEKPPLPWPMAVLPLVFAIVMVTLMDNPMFLMFGLMTPLMLLSMYWTNNRGRNKNYKQKMAKWRESVARTWDEAKDSVVREVHQSRIEYPDPTRVLEMTTRHTSMLWNRRPSDETWLRVRIGTGTVDSKISVDDPEKLEFERTHTWQLEQFPVTIPFAESGVVGFTGEHDTVFPVAQYVLAQISALHSTRDVQLYLLSPRQTLKSNQSHTAAQHNQVDWHFAQWLPHMSPRGGQETLRTIAVTAEQLALRISELTQIMESRQAELERHSAQYWPGNNIVVVLEHAHVVRQMPGVIRLLKEGPKVGILFLCLDADERLLPEECETVITATKGMLSMESNVTDDVVDIMPDLVTGPWLEAVSMAMAPLEDDTPDESAMSIPDQSRLLDLLELTPAPSEIAQHWFTQPRSTSCVIGESVDGAFSLDIVKDGPHGLIGGTTGSGKSELLQSLVASLAVVNAPSSLNFVLVDYKGGAAFKDCVNLPHTVGMVTDLDNHLVARALTSLGAELHYRETLLAQAGAKDLEDYLDYRQSNSSLVEIPRLLIVIDEFASLARELPDFVTGLVNIAQRGRSLGIHLILATQRPGGVVSPEIRANTNLRIALRMTDAQESEDVIDAQDAANISKSTPGRAVVRLGSNSLVPFQSARVGGRYVTVESEAVAPDVAPFLRAVNFDALGAPKPRRPKQAAAKGDVAVTDLTMLVDAITEVAKQEHYPAQRRPWLPALPTNIRLSELAGSHPDGISIPFGVADYPHRQLQQTLEFVAAQMGNLFFIGTSRTGRSTALRTFAYSASTKYSPEAVQLHCIDAGNGGLAPLIALPHVGTVANRTETEKVVRLITRLEATVKARSAALAAEGYSTIDEYNLAHTTALSHIFVLLDSWDGFTVAFETYDSGTVLDRVQNLMREGISAGIHFLVTGDRTLLSGRLSLLSDNKLVLRMVDPTDYSFIGIPSRDVPEDIPDGRGWWAADTTEIQLATIGGEMTGQQEAELIRQTGQELKTRWAHLPASSRPFTVEELPHTISVDDINTKISAGQLDQPADSRHLLLGLGGENNDGTYFDPNELPFLPIYGPMKSGKTTTLITLINEGLRAGYRIIIAAPKTNALAKFANDARIAKFWDDPSQLTEEAVLQYLSDADDQVHTLFVFDDCHLLKDIPAGGLLERLLANMGNAKATFITAGDVTDFPSGFGNWGSRVKTLRQGILLRPEDIIHQDLIGIRLRRADVRTEAPKGRGYINIAGAKAQVQIANSPIEPAQKPTFVPVGQEI